MQKRHKLTDDGGQCYLVKQIEKVINGDSFDVTLLCTEVAFGSHIRIRIPADSVELSGICTEENEKDRNAQEVLSEYLSEAKKIEIVIYSPRDTYSDYLGSLCLDDHFLGDMLLKESFGEAL